MNKLIYKSSILMFFMIIMPFVDTLNGIVQLEIGINISLGIVYRLCLLIICVWILYDYKVKYKYFAIYVLWLIYLFVTIIFHIEANKIQDLKDVITISMIPILYLSLEKSTRLKGRMEKLLFYYSIAYPLTLIIPYVLKLGFSAYGDSGFRGYYIALNAISNTIVITSIYSIFCFFRKMNLKNIVSIILNSFCIIIMGTKSSYIILALTFIILLLYDYKKRNGLVLKNFIIVSLLLIGGICVLLLRFDKIVSIFERWEYFFHTRSFISFMTSDRSSRIIPSMFFICTSPNRFLYLLFGYGNIVNVNLENSLIEMDMFDVLFMTGFVGFILFSFVLFFMIKYVLKNGFFVQKYMIIVILLLSFFVGHVMTNALSGAIVAIFLTTINRKNYDNSYSINTNLNIC